MLDGFEDNWDLARERMYEKAKQILIDKKGIPKPTDAQIMEQKRQSDSLRFPVNNGNVMESQVGLSMSCRNKLKLNRLASS